MTTKSEVKLEDMTVEDRVKYHYEHGQGSIQDIARVYRLQVSEVLHIIGQDEMMTVEDSHGDLVDAAEAGPTADINYQGNIHPVSYDVS